LTDGALRLELFVADLERSVSFYEVVLGFVCERREGDYASLRRGSALLGFGLMAHLPDGHPAKARTAERAGAGVEIVLEVGDVDGAFDAVRTAGHPVQTPLDERPWGLRDFRVVDPDGYYVRVTSA
jgi:catechol 2,3-dioxygenase-like lactoylglutathione lyase family enzyme